MTLLDPTPDETAADRLRMTWPGWAIATGLLGWAFCVTNDRGGRALLCYPFIALACAGLIGIASRRFQRWWVSYAGAAMAAMVLVWWGSVDTYNTKWHRGLNRYNDTFTRWGDRIIYRDIDFCDSPEDAAKFFSISPSACGPMAGTGKPHGEWRYDYGGPDYRSEAKFYWYGDEISEGEWHLRNK